MIKVRVPDYYDKFKCTGSDCPDTCCIGWLIEVDQDALLRFNSLEGKIGDKVRGNIFKAEDGKSYFKLNEKGRCTFLNDNNLCQMYIDLGEESQCALCANYPRIGEDFGGLRELGLSISCPEVAQIILENGVIGFEAWDIDENCRSEEDYSDDVTFKILLAIRDLCVSMAQNKNYSVHIRLKLYLMLASRLQTAMDNNDYDEMIFVYRDFSNEAYIEKCVKTLDNLSGGRKEFLENVYCSFEKLDFISEEWIKLLTKARKSNGRVSLEQCTYEQKFENIFVYLILRYFMKIVRDSDIYSKAVFTVVAILVIEELIAANKDTQDWVCVYRFSKEIEHCEENMEMLYNLFWEEPFNNPGNIFSSIE